MGGVEIAGDAAPQPPEGAGKHTPVGIAEEAAEKVTEGEKSSPQALKRDHI